MRAVYLSRLLFLVSGLAGISLFAQQPAEWQRVVITNVPPTHDYSVRLWTTAQGLPLNYIQALTQTRDGFLWVGTRAGLARFDGTRFTVFTTANTPAFKSHNCLSLKEGLDGTLWIGTVDGVVRYANHEFTHIPVPYFHPDGRWVQGMAISPSGEVWLATRRGPGWISGSQFVPDETFPTYSYPNSNVKSRECLSIGFDRAGDLVVSNYKELLRRHEGRWEQIYQSGAHEMFNTPEGELWMVDPYLRNIEAGKPVHKEEGGGVSPLVFCAGTADPHGQIWTATKTNVYRGGGDFQQISFTPEISGEINVMRADREGNIWIGTSEGLAELTKNLFRAITPADGLPSPDAWSISEGPDGSMWVGTHGGLSRIHNGGIENWIWKAQPWNNSSSAQNVLATRAGEIWCNPLGCLWKKNAGGGEQFARDEKHARIAGLPVYEEADGTVWTADFFKATRWKRDSAIESLAIEGGCLGMLRDPAGRLWVGTGGEGVLIFANGATNRLHLKDGLVGEHCRPVLAEADGTVWIASNQGLNRWRNGELKGFTFEDGLPEDYILNLLEDDFGWFWLNGHRGVYRVEKRVLNEFADGTVRRISFVAYNEANGLPSVEGNGGSLPNSCKARDGRLWFPTIKGVAIVNPAEAHAPAVPALPVVTSIRVDKESALDDRKGFAGSLPEIRFGPGRGRVTRIEFTAPAFSPNNSPRYLYRLDPEDSDWMDSQGERYAIYTNLKPGAYRFRLKAFNGDNVPAEAAPIVLIFAPHLYETIPFYIALTLGVAAAVAAIHLMRLRVQRQILGLEKQNALQQERSRIAADIHDALGADLTRIALLSERLHRDGSNDEKAVTGISETVRAMGTSMSELIWATNSRNDTLDNLVSYIRAHAAAQCESAGLKLVATIAEFPEWPVSGLARHHVYLIFREALTNILKHARARVARLEIQLSGDVLELVLEDDGGGFTPDPGSRGNGHLNLRKRAEDIGAELKIGSGENGQGTRVRLRLPISPAGPEHDHSISA